MYRIIIIIFFYFIFGYCNTNIYDLGYEEKEMWIQNFKSFKEDIIFEKFVDIHVRNFDFFHNSDTLFLPFHEIYLNLFRNISSLELYYWNFREVPIKKFVEDYGGFGIFCSRGICYQRRFRSSKLSIKNSKDYINYNLKEFTVFLRDEIHNKIHQYVGGTFISPYSPRDILFYPFHQYINMLYMHYIGLKEYNELKNVTKYILLNTEMDDILKNIIVQL